MASAFHSWRNAADDCVLAGAVIQTRRGCAGLQCLAHQDTTEVLEMTNPGGSLTRDHHVTSTRRTLSGRNEHTTDTECLVQTVSS
jgi:hypothetical protein